MATKSSPTILPITRPVVLVGLMGAGKTTIGRRLAGILDLPFVDSDQEISEAAGCSISDIFEIYGESSFRDLEQKILTKLVARPACVIATGGGAYINPTIRETVKKNAISVWLRADLEVLLERVSRRDHRPLLKGGDKEEILRKLMQERYPIYSEVDIIIDTNTGSHEHVVDKIVHALGEFQNER